MKRVYVKHGVISTAFRDPPYLIGKPPRSLRTEGTIMVYKVDRKKLRPRKPDDD